MRQRLDTLAAQRGETISIVVREAIEFYLDAREALGLADKSPLPDFDQVGKFLGDGGNPILNEPKRTASKGHRKGSYL